MFSWNAKGFSLLQQLGHHLSAFHLSNLALPAAIASGVYTDRGLLHAVFRILCGKQTVTNRQNSIAIRPAQHQHAEAVGVDMPPGVVKSSTFSERAQLYMESSMMSTLSRSSLVKSLS